MGGHVLYVFCIVAALTRVHSQLVKPDGCCSDIGCYPQKLNLPDVAATLDAATIATKVKPVGCGSDIGCYHDCDDSGCGFVVTWKGSENSVDFSLNMDLATAGTTPLNYISLGLSDDDKMGDDSVTDCIMSGFGGSSVTVAKSYNEPGAKSNSPIAESQSGLSNTTGSVTDGVLTCTYTQTKASSNDKVKSLNSKWTLFVAQGTPDNGLKNQHRGIPNISPQEVDFDENADVSGTKKNIGVKVHGCLMMFAWMFCASIGIFLARFYKNLWPNNKLCSEKVWFAFHRTCMVLAVSFCAAGFIVIFVEVQMWSELDGHSDWQRAHPYLGCIVTFLAVLNPVMALCRPHPEDDNRFIFNWAHWAVGTGAHILAGLTIILGVTLDKASVPYYCVYIVVAWIVYQMVVVLFTELCECIIDDRGHRYFKDGKLKEPKGAALKKFLLAMHVIVITGLTIAAIVVVAIN